MKHIPTALGFALSFIVGALVFIHPDIVQAQSGGLVPCTGAGGENPCDFCDLEILARNIINFLIGVFSSVAALMFAYAGFLYLTGGTNPSQISRAHSIFWNVVIGLLFVLAAWLLVDTLMKALLDRDNYGPWNSICQVSGEAGAGGVNNPDRGAGGVNNPDLGAGGVNNPDTQDQSQTGVPLDERSALEKATEESILREQLRNVCTLANGEPCITVNNNGRSCGVNQTYQAYRDANGAGCTDVSLLKAETVGVIEDVARECNEDLQACEVVITGGTELGHTCTASAGTHCSGDKFDVRPTAAVNGYVETSEHFENVDVCGRGSGYRHVSNGSVWINEGDHWDVVQAEHACVE